MGFGFFSGRSHCDECGMYTDGDTKWQKPHEKWHNLCIKCGDKFEKQLHAPPKRS